MNSQMQSSKGQPQAFVDQGPRFEKKPIRQNQVLSKAGIIRPNKRKKAKYY